MSNDKSNSISSAKSVAPSLPLVRLNSAEPIAAELDRRGLLTDDLLEGVGLSRQAMNDADTFVHALVLYQFLEAAADAAGEKDFAATIAENLDLTKWYPTVGLIENARTTCDLLTAWVVTASKHSSAIEQRLDIRGATAVLYGHRSFRLTLVPSQVDGFHVGFLISILRHAMGAEWKPSDVLVTVSDPRALPLVFHGIKAIKGNRRGHKIRFPAKWLARSFDETDFLRRALIESESFKPAKTVVESIKQAIRPHLGVSNLAGAQIASICGMKHRYLTHLLNGEGTNLTTITNDLRKEMAIEKLAQQDATISEIATKLGYSDATSFTRAFKKWTGSPPTRYRNS
jgi:AraC-like DNA-binding protein